MINIQNKNYILITTVILILTLVFSCSSDSNSTNNTNNNLDYQLQMFSGITRVGFVSIPNDNLIYIRFNNDTNLIDFIRIDNQGNQTITDITTILNSFGISESYALYHANNQVNLIFLETINTSQQDLKMVSFDYNGTLIGEQTIETNSIYSELRLHQSGFIAYNEVIDLQEHTLYYKIYNSSGNSIITETVDLSEDNTIVDDVYFENNTTYIIGKNEFQQGSGYTNAVCKGYNSAGQLTSSANFDIVANSNQTLRVLNNRIHRSYNSGLGTAFEIYDVDGMLINSNQLQQLLKFTYNTSGQFIYVGYNFTSEKSLDFVIMDNLAEAEIVKQNFGALNSSGSTGDGPVFSIYETENFYNVLGQTTAPKNGDFDVPENSSSFDDYIVRFNKN